MSYSITYTWEREPEPRKKASMIPAIVSGLALIAGAVAFRLLVPQSDALVEQLFHPLTDAETLSAVSELTERLKDGVPMVEAVTAFCREILQHG